MEERRAPAASAPESVSSGRAGSGAGASARLARRLLSAASASAWKASTESWEALRAAQ